MRLNTRASKTRVTAFISTTNDGSLLFAYVSEGKLHCARRVKALEESAHFLAAGVIAAELEAALEQFATIAEDLNG